MFHFKSKNEEISEIDHPLSDLLEEHKTPEPDYEDWDSVGSSSIPNSPIRTRFSDRFRIRKKSSDASNESQEQKTGLLVDIKGKIVKRVEDKITEYKSDKWIKSLSSKNVRDLPDLSSHENLSSESIEQMSIEENPDISYQESNSSPKESYLSSIREKVAQLPSLEDLKKRRLKIGPSAIQGLLADDPETDLPEVETGLEADEKDDKKEEVEFKDAVEEEVSDDWVQVPGHSVPVSTPLNVPEETENVALRNFVGKVAEYLHTVHDGSKSYYLFFIAVFSFILVLPPFLSGLIAGSLVSVIILFNYEPNRSKNIKFEAVKEPFTPILEYREEEGCEDWFFELRGEYDSSLFRSGMLNPVYVKLRNSSLTLLVPKPSFKLKRIQEYGEDLKAPSFIQRRSFNMKDAYVTLLPKNLSGLRVWNKRYPISITFPDRQTETQTEVQPDPGEFELIEQDCCEEKNLILFARTDRTKDRWLRLLIAAAKNQSSIDECEGDQKLNFTEYMTHILSTKVKAEDLECGQDPLLWFNAFKGRILYDFLTTERWKEYVKKKMEKKLLRIKFPQFMSDVKVSDINLGKNIPVILSCSDPIFNKETGIWIDFDIEYEGGFQMAIETKLNMLKAAEKECEMSEMNKRPESFSDSGSDDEEFCDLEGDTQRILEAAGEDTRTSKIGSVFDKITQSRYFQQASEHKYVRKALEGMSGLRLMLQVEVLSLKGKMVINIPPPPADRIWYGFRTPPEFNLRAVPKAGERSFTMGIVTDWIEKQLIKEFERIFVYPNMDEQYILLMDASRLY
ncbi:testis-expressed protein 2-like [Artemia franciscana]|uniref:SMP-LTD domain-containing protein n=1 Tax=Artemia franciscana TaxID=6661 RepID=A0AA88HTP7_ARTSF|nr:hypothetical protein QYM36_011988 [Artemia franciscana]